MLPFYPLMAAASVYAAPKIALRGRQGPEPLICLARVPSRKQGVPMMRCLPLNCISILRYDER